MKLKTALSAILICYQALNFQILADSYKPIIDIPTTSVKNQAQSGTCWCFSMISFLETELIRMGRDTIGLSEMFIVNNCYREKGVYSVRMHDEAFFTAGGECHDVLWTIKKFGIMPRENYTGLKNDAKNHNHMELCDVLTSHIRAITSKSEITKSWHIAYNATIDSYLGNIPKTFTYKDNSYTPLTFAKTVVNLNLDDYISITSFTHHPFYTKFALEVPDNWLHGEMYNVTIDEFEEIVDNAINNGYSVVFGADVSENGFSFNDGLMVTDQNDITQEMRQEDFDSYKTTDDHGMHIIGTAKDSTDNIFYKVKNSWGTDNKYGGYMYMSKSFLRYKVLDIMVHRDAIPQKIRQKLGL